MDEEEERRPLLWSGAQRNNPTRRKFQLNPVTRIRIACFAVLATETCERIAFYGLVGNLVMFLNHEPFLWVSYDATNALFVFAGLSYILSIFGGWFADTILGRFKSILLFMGIYLTGYAFFPILAYWPHFKHSTPGWCSSHNITDTSSTTVKPLINDHAVTQKNIINNAEHTLPCWWVVYLSIVIMAIGNGSMRANIAPFGADQIKQSGIPSTRSFFNIFYWCINLGALIGQGPLAGLEQNWSFFFGYVITFSFLVIAFFIFLTGGIAYNMKPPTGSVLTNIGKVVLDACRARRRSSENRVVLMNSVTNPQSASRSWIDLAKLRYGGSFHDRLVDDVKTLGKIFLVFLALIPYWIVYFQMLTTFQIQGLHMRLDFTHRANVSNSTVCRVTDPGFQFPAASLSLFNVLCLIVLIPVLDRVVYPYLDRRGHAPSLRGRIIIGMVFAMVAVAIAGGLETWRLATFWKGGSRHVYPQWIGKSCYFAADLSIFWQIPQYALIGISEAFASVAGLELAYTTAPRSMQGLIMGLFWLCQGLGSMLGTATMSAFHGAFFFDWDHGDINCRYSCSEGRTCSCHLDFYFYFLVFVQLLGIVIFMVVAWRLDIGYRKELPSHSPGNSPPRSESPKLPTNSNNTHVQTNENRGHNITM